jgi:phage recombination protein Bet
MNTKKEIAKIPAKKSLLLKIADRFSVEPAVLQKTLSETVFKGATEAQTVALLIVSDQYGLNPFTKEIYAFPSKGGGIVPIVGIDGWLRIINEHPQFDGMEFEQDDEQCTCKIFRKDRTHPVIVTEYHEECKRNTDPWNNSPKRMLRHKSIIQCARVAFGFGGIHDEDEGKIIANAEFTEITRKPIAMPEEIPPAAQIEQQPKTEQPPEAPKEQKPELTGREKLIADALVVIGDGGAAVTSWAFGTGKIKAGQTWKDLPDDALLTAAKSGKGFMKMVNIYIDGTSKVLYQLRKAYSEE